MHTPVHPSRADMQPPSAGIVVEAHELSAMILGQSHIELKGFTSGGMDDLVAPPVSLRATPLRAGAHSLADIPTLNKSQDERTRMRRAGIAVAMAGAIALSVIAGKMLAPGGAGSWKVTSIEEGAISISIGGEHSIKVKTGSLLPDGTRLIATDTSKQIYSTSEYDARIRTAPHASGAPR